jgi:hypothetical protein
LVAVERLGKRLHMLDALFAQQGLCLFDRQAFFVQEVLNTAQKQHIRWAIVAPSTGAFDGFDLRELAFPETQHMRRYIQPFCYLADGAKGVRGLGHGATLYWLRRIGLAHMGMAPQTGAGASFGMIGEDG